MKLLILIYLSGVLMMLIIMIGQGIYDMFLSKDINTWEETKRNFLQLGWISAFSWIAVALMILPYIDRR